jgi:thioredoxin-related protein
MKHSVLLPALLLLTATAIRPAAAQHGPAWTIDLDAALARAATSGKDVLLVFTGSDWCAPCKQLAKEVWTVEEFTKTAAERYELVVIDSPRKKDTLDAATVAKNEALRERFAVNSWPSVFLVDALGRPFARTKDYRPGGPAQYLEHLQQLQAAKARRDAALAKANDAKGPARAALLDEALLHCGEFVPMAPYAALVDDLLAADPKDESTVAARWRARRASDALEVELPKLGQAGNWKEFVARIDAFLAEHRADPLVMQKTLFWHGTGLLRVGQRERAAASLERAVALGAETEYGARSKELLPRTRKD